MAKRKPKRPAGEGYAWEFHGAYNSEAKAKEKARKVGGWYQKKSIRRRDGARYKRWVVMTAGTPF